MNNSSKSILSAGLFIGLFSSATAQYCASGASSTADSKCDEVILIGNSVTINNNTSVPCATYTDFTNSIPAADISPGQTYSITITAGTCGGNYTKYVNAWIDYNGNQVFDHPTEALGGPNGSAGIAATGAVVFVFTVPTVTAVGRTRLRVMVAEGTTPNNPCLNYTWGETEDYSVDINVQFDNDAGIVGVPNPGVPACTAYSDSMEVEFFNYGKLDLDSLMIGWIVNDSLMTPVKWSGKVGTLKSGTATLKYFKTLKEGDTLTAWTYLPNGIADSFKINDTLYYVFVNGLSGTYSVGGPTADFKTLDSAVTELNKRGVCTPVIFELKDTIHTWRGTIRQFHGSSSQRWVTFTSATGDTTLCRIQFQSTSASNQYVVNIDGGQFIKFESLGIRNLASGAYSGVINITGQAREIMFNDCYIRNNDNSTSSGSALIASAPGKPNYGLHVLNSLLQNGSRAVFISGDKFKGRFDGIHLQNNTMLNQGLDAVSLTLVNNVSISGNTVTSNATAGGTGFSINNVSGGCSIEQNSVLSITNWPRRGIFINRSNGQLLHPNVIANNVIKLADTSSTLEFTGIYLDTSAFNLVAHNTIAIEGKNTASAAFVAANSGGNNIYNNIFANLGKGLAMSYAGLGSVLQSDYNNLYSTGSDLGANSGVSEVNLAGWQLGSGFDLNSISANPGFSSRLDLQPCGIETDKAGTPLSLIAEDRDGVQRDPQTPDPGAYEFASPGKFDVGNQFNICNGDTFTLSPSVSSNDLLIWNNTDTSFTFHSPNAGTYTVTNISQCGTGRDTITVHINALIQLPNDTNICSDDTLTIVSNVSGTLMWEDGNTNSSRQITTAGRYSIEAIDNNGCYSNDTVYVTKSLAVSLPKDTSICEGNTVQLDPHTGAGNYNWNNGSMAPVIFVDSSYTYSLSFTDVFGCNSTGSVKLTVIPMPKGGFTTAQSQSNVSFKAKDTTATSYHWSFGDGRSFNGTYKTVNVYSLNGSYKVTLTLSNQCGTTIYDSTMEIGTIGIQYVVDGGLVSIFPNPAKDRIFIQIKNESIQRVQLTDMLGQVIRDISYSQKVSDSALELAGVPTGQYLLRVEHGNSISSSKIIIHQ